MESTESTESMESMEKIDVLLQHRIICHLDQEQVLPMISIIQIPLNKIEMSPHQNVQVQLELVEEEIRIKQRLAVRKVQIETEGKKEMEEMKEK